MMDEALGTCARFEFPTKTTETVHLGVKYLKPTPADEIYILEAKLVNIEGNAGWVEGTMRILNENTSLVTAQSASEKVVTGRAEYRHIESSARI